MFSKSQLWLPLMLFIAVLLLFGSCKKSTTTTLDDAVSAEDHSNMNAAINSASDDATNVAGGIPSFAGKTESSFSVCNATVDSTQLAAGIITVTFTGNACGGNISRSGQMVLTLHGYATGTRWKDQGAMLQIDFNAVKVTNVATGGSITLNGTHYLTNTTGGVAWKVINGAETGPVSHHHTATNFTITFDDGTQRTWSVDRVRTYTNPGNAPTITVSSDNTVGSDAHVDAWGTNRKGDAFVSQIVSPIVANQTCGWYKPTSGDFTHHVANRSVDILYGVDSNGNPVTSGCGWGYKVTYEVNGRSRTKLVSYWF